jgi:hypothetical protein
VPTSLADVADERLLRHRLTGEPAGDVESAVRWLAGVQGQEYPVARWSLGQRAVDVVEHDVDGALASGRLVRTHVLRDTWHLVAAVDLRWLVLLTRPRIQRRNVTTQRKLDLDGALLARTDQLLCEALRGGAQLTRPELADALSRHGIEATGLRLGYILMHAELELLICSGGLRGRQQTYALVDERVPPGCQLQGDDALAELARRYFRSRSPAAERDLAVWASLTLGDARRAVGLLGDAVSPIDVAGRRLWRWAEPPPPERPGAPRAHLLQGYDEYVMSYSETRDVLDVGGLAGVTPAGEHLHLHAVLVDGQVIGHWRRRPHARRVVLDVQLARALAADERAALEAAVERYGEFAGLPVQWAAG